MIAVAPYMGAWIETLTYLKYLNEIQVAPYMGAWIETSNCWSQSFNPYGRSLYGSVDWNREKGGASMNIGVAPYMGAWIET